MYPWEAYLPTLSRFTPSLETRVTPATRTNSSFPVFTQRLTVAAVTPSWSAEESIETHRPLGDVGLPKGLSFVLSRTWLTKLGGSTCRKEEALKVGFGAIDSEHPSECVSFFSVSPFRVEPVQDDGPVVLGLAWACLQRHASKGDSDTVDSAFLCAFLETSNNGMVRECSFYERRTRPIGKATKLGATIAKRGVRSHSRLRIGPAEVDCKKRNPVLQGDHVEPNNRSGPPWKDRKSVV